MPIKRYFRGEHFAAMLTVVRERSREVNGLDVASDVGDGLVLVGMAQPAYDRVRGPGDKLVEIGQTCHFTSADSQA